MLYSSTIKFNSDLSTLFIIFSIFGFPFFVTTSLIIGTDTSLGSIIYRAIVAFLALLLIAVNIKHLKKINLTQKILILYLLIYGLRLIYDLSIRELYRFSPHYDSENFIYLFFFGAALLPVIATTQCQFDYSQLGKKIFYTSFIQCIVVVIGLYKIYGTNISELLIDRTLYTNENFNNGTGSPLNPILVSRCGAILLILLISEVLILKNKIPLILKISAIPLSIVLIFLGGSRNPLMVSLIGVVVILLVFLKNAKFKKRIKTLFITTLFAILTVFIIFSSNVTEKIGIFNRIEKGLSNNSGVLGRDGHYESAINQFINNPFIGDQVFDKHLWIYPHNLILESFMALGIVGGALFLTLSFLNLKKITYNFIPNNKILFPILFLMFFLFGMSSGGIFNSNEFWLVLALSSKLNKNLVF